MFAGAGPTRRRGQTVGAMVTFARTTVPQQVHDRAFNRAPVVTGLTGYTPDLQDAAVQNVLQQAEALSAEWTGTVP